jgi:hypothetical protein
MTAIKQQALLGITLVMLSAGAVSGEQVPAAPVTKKVVRPTTLKPSAKTPDSVIAGTVIDQNALPLPAAHVRLRNLQTKEIEQTTTTNTRGEFVFVVKPELPYVVELVDRSGQIVAVGDVVVTRIGEVAGTLLRAPARIPGISDLFGDTASAIFTAVSGLGITAFDQDQPPVSPEK